jgi:hypothetical protein
VGLVYRINEFSHSLDPLLSVANVRFGVGSLSKMTTMRTDPMSQLS